MTDTVAPEGETAPAGDAGPSVVQPGVWRGDRSPAGWYDDPSARFRYRRWDGTSWSVVVHDGTSAGTDPAAVVMVERPVPATVRAAETRARVARRIRRQRIRRFVAAVCLLSIAAGVAIVWSRVSQEPTLIAPASVRLLTSGADPTAIALGPDEVVIFTTNNVDATRMNIPSFTWQPSTDHVSEFHDALPAPPGWVGGPTFTWAPTVRFVGDRYVMLLSASQKLGANCIGLATAPTAADAFVPDESIRWCDPDPNVGLLDPELFTASDGTLWLHVSRQWATGSEIDAQRLSPDALSRVGPMKPLVSYSDVAGLNPDNGSRPELENPSMLARASGPFDLMMSIGTWGSAGYNTIVVPCDAADGPCHPVSAATVSLATATAGPVGTGGASVVGPTNDDPLDNWIVFHGYPTVDLVASGRRSIYVATATSSP